jgi:hypothetical protein
MPKLWSTPVYEFPFFEKKVIIDVTGSVSESLPPKKTIKDLLQFLEIHKVRKILDFGAGALRHTKPLIEAGFEVYAVEYNEQFLKKSCKKALEDAKRNLNFNQLIFPSGFIKDKTKFDFVLLCYVLQIMPIADERKRVLELISKKMNKNSYLLYMSQFGQITEEVKENPILDGYLKGMKYKNKTFYREFAVTETLNFFESYGLKRTRSLGERGQEQVYLFSKGDAKWP